MRKFIFFIVVALFIISCNNGVKQSDYDKLQKELTDCRNELAECKNTVNKLQNSPQVILAKGQEYLTNNDLINAKNVLNSLVERFVNTDEAVKAQILLGKIDKQEKEKKEIEESKIGNIKSFDKYINECKSKKYTCIKIKHDAVYVIRSLTANQTKWEYYEIGKEKIVYRAKLRGTLPFNIANMNLIGWDLTDPKGLRLLGAVAINLSTYKRGIVLYKNGQQQVFDEVH